MSTSINARMNAATLTRTGSDNEAFFYIDGIPTKGCWVDMDDVRSWEDIHEALAVHFPNTDFDDILVADATGLCVHFYSSSCDAFSMNAWSAFAEDVARSDLDPEVIDAYCSNFCSEDECDVSKAEDCYMGEYDSEEAFAEEYADNCCLFDQCPDVVRSYFDFQAYWDCELRHYFWESNGHYFRNE